MLADGEQLVTSTTTLNPSICMAAKWAFTTRRIDRRSVRGLSTDIKSARVGDLILCEVAETGNHKKIQLAERRTSQLYVGDLIILCLGHRYAPDQYLASAIIDGDVIDLVAGGGIAGRVDAAHELVSKPTKLRPIALPTGVGGKTLNVADDVLPDLPANDEVTVLGVLGASMNSGKTVSATCLAHGLKRSGHSVAAVKATGTGAFGDFNSYEDGGVPALDFTDVGMATTFRMPLARIERGFDTLVSSAAARGAEIVVVEIADGVFQQETRALLRSSRIRDRLDGILFAAPDALSAFGGIVFLKELGLRPFAISGVVSCSPLASAEATEVTGLPILSRSDLCAPKTISALTAPLLRQSRGGVAA